jgi:hypothetical protein
VSWDVPTVCITSERKAKGTEVADLLQTCTAKQQERGHPRYCKTCCRVSMINEQIGFQRIRARNLERSHLPGRDCAVGRNRDCAAVQQSTGGDRSAAPETNRWAREERALGTNGRVVGHGRDASLGADGTHRWARTGRAVGHGRDAPLGTEKVS